MPVSKFQFGPTFEQEIFLGYSLFDVVTDREERDGSVHIQGPSGQEDSWIVGRDYVIDAEVRWIPDGPNTSPVQTQLSGAMSWQYFLDWIRDANPLRFIPDISAPGFFIDNVYLVDPRKGFGSLSAMINRNVKIKLRNATTDFHQALRGIMLQVQAGMSLTDPTTLTFARADATTCATRIKRDGTIETVAANVLRIQWEDLDGDGVRETPGYLLEGSRTNSCLQSEDFSTTWVPTRSSISVNADTAPDGTVSADRLIEDATASATHPVIQGVTITANENVSVSVIAKAGTRSWIVLHFERLSNGAINAERYFNLATGAMGTASGNGGATIISSGMIPLGNGWYRCYVSGNIGGGFTDGAIRVGLATGDGVQSYSGDGASYVSLWGGQLERAAAFPSSYIKTVASAVTRAPDSLSLPFTFGPMDTTVLCRLARPVWAGLTFSPTIFPGPWQLGAGANPQAFQFYRSDSAQWTSMIRTPGPVDSRVTAAFPAGNEVRLLSQFKNFGTDPETALDVGSGLGAFSAGAAAIMSAYSNQTLQVGRGDAAQELYGVLLELKIGSGLRTLAQMLAL